MINNKFKSFFNEYGFVVINDFFSNNEVELISDFVEVWINKNIDNALNKNKIYLKIKDFPDYHNFIINNKIDHAKIASAIYRYIEPPENIIKTIHKKLLFEYLNSFSGFNKFKKWQDPGFGWLGYRLIRANSNDGYPPSCKNWGAASNVYSMWLPIAGCNESSNIRFLPKSHKREFKKYLPENTKFTKGEFRLDENISDSEFIRPNVSKNGIIIYHPACIHSEDSADMKITRLNLEYRFKPIDES
tara:strand:- start:231 stop:965 length:735 start_codon:yes stop_codon:yes gene_type:complete